MDNAEKILLDYDNLVDDIIENTKKNMTSDITKQLLEVLGLKFDHWGRLENLDREFIKEIEKSPKIKKLKNELIIQSREEIANYKLSIREKNRIVKLFFEKIEDEIIDTLYVKYKDEIIAKVSHNIEKAIINHPALKEFYLNKL